mgnify:CR=1 FL=1
MRLSWSQFRRSVVPRSSTRLLLLGALVCIVKSTLLGER